MNAEELGMELVNGKVTNRVRCEAIINEGEDNEQTCMNTARSTTCHDGKKHSLGMIHVGNKIVPACTIHANEEKMKMWNLSQRFNTLNKRERLVTA